MEQEPYRPKHRVIPEVSARSRCNVLPNVDSAHYSEIIRYLFFAGPVRLKAEDSTR